MLDALSNERTTGLDPIAETPPMGNVDKRNTLLSMRQAAAYVGWTGRHGDKRVRRELLAIEKRTGKTILVRVGNGSARPTYRITVRSLRRHLPQLFARHDNLPDVVREAFARQDVRHAEHKTNLITTRSRIRELSARVEVLEAALNRATNRT